ncbi:hypothetical protein J6T66_04025 [bacterium]|nr:hypothetical protein [bacterium]
MRDDVSIPSVTSEVFEKDGKNLLYLEVSIISNKTTALLLEEVRDALETAGKIDGIILDLRGNS